MIDVEQIKQQVDFLELASQYTQLKKGRGDEYIGKCPLPSHEDSTPSFTLNTDKGVYYCHGCGESGDVISFVEQMEGIEFKQALNKLCDGNVEVCKIDYNRSRMRDFMRLIEELKDIDTGEVFGEHLVAKHKKNIHKSFGDKYKKDTLDFFKIGYCVDELDELYRRTTIPWWNVKDELVAIVGRASWDSNSKYLAKTGSNKGNHLYNLNNAKKYGQQGIVIVEDEKSVWRLNEFGYYNTVAMGNCSLGDRKYLLRKYTDKIIIATDECQSGYKAAKKIYNETKHMFQVELLRWDDKYKDIDEITDKSYFDECYENKRRL